MSFEQGISKVEPYSITNILTLRYDPSVTPIFPKKTWQDISPQSFQTVDFFEKLIEKNINHTIETHQTKKISIALSGGVDSTLVLAMIRKMFPDIEIDALSIKFADSVDETKKASQIADKFEANHHILHVENYLRNLPEAISIIKLPFWDLALQKYLHELFEQNALTFLQLPGNRQLLHLLKVVSQIYFQEFYLTSFLLQHLLLLQFFDPQSFL